MSEPIDKLSRFTPDGTGLDRDALLFAAGKAAARADRGWVALAGALAASHLLTLVLLWPPAAPDVATPPGVNTASPDRQSLPPARENGSPPVPDASSLFTLQRQFLETGPAPVPARPAGDLVPDPLPLRAYPISDDIFVN